MAFPWHRILPGRSLLLGAFIVLASYVTTLLAIGVAEGLSGHDGDHWGGLAVLSLLVLAARRPKWRARRAFLVAMPFPAFVVSWQVLDSSLDDVLLTPFTLLVAVGISYLALWRSDHILVRAALAPLVGLLGLLAVATAPDPVRPYGGMLAATGLAGYLLAWAWREPFAVLRRMVAGLAAAVLAAWTAVAWADRAEVPDAASQSVAVASVAVLLLVLLACWRLWPSRPVGSSAA